MIKEYFSEEVTFKQRAEFGIEEPAIAGVQRDGVPAREKNKYKVLTWKQT